MTTTTHDAPECRACGGDGRIDISDPLTGITPRMETCPDCDGTGEEPRKTCCDCGEPIEYGAEVRAGETITYCPTCAAQELKEQQTTIADLRVILRETQTAVVEGLAKLTRIDHPGSAL
jgi:hypothetical protein